MQDPQSVWIPNNNFFVGRNANRAYYIILHGTAGGTSATGIANYFKSTEGTTSPVSSHYIIDQAGTIVCCVAEENSAWANGAYSIGHDPWWNINENPNHLTISIEHVKQNADNGNQLTPLQQQASFGLVQRICQRWSIPMQSATVRGGITGHYSIDPVNRSNCPGPYPWQALWTFLQGGNNTMLDLTDPVVARYFTDGGNGTWKCNNGVILLGGNLTFYRSNGGPALLGLPLANEIHLAQYPNTAIVPCERALIVYDPNRVIDHPPMDGPCYLLHINAGIGQQIVAKALTDPLNTQIAALQAQLKKIPSLLGMPTQIEDYKQRLQQIYELSRIPS
jgi:hypothetical protein